MPKPGQAESRCTGKFMRLARENNMPKTAKIDFV